MSTKKPVRETAATSRGLAFLIESELEKAEVVLAAKSILEKLQGMAEDLAKVEANDIMPMLDGMRLTFGPELADSFNATTTAKLRQTTEAIKAAKDAIASEVAKLEGSVNGEMTNDMSMGGEGEAPELGGLGDEAGLGDMGGDQMGGDPLAGGDQMGDEAGMGDMGDEAGAEGDMGDLDAAFDDAAESNTAAGRARKESVEMNVKALRESKNPDRLVYEIFKRTLKETRNATVAATAVANAFDIDLNDVIDVVKEGAVKEGKTFKDEAGKTSKNKDRTLDREHKARNRPKDIDEGKTFKDEAGKTDKNKDRSEDRAAKNRERPKDIDEGKTFKDEKGNSDKNKDRSEDRADKKRARPVEESTRPFDSVVAESGPASKKVCPDCGAEEVVATDVGQSCDACEWTSVAESLVNRMKPRKSLNDLATKTLDAPDSRTAMQRAAQDFKSHINRTMEVPYVYGLVDGESHQFNARPQDPFIVRVTTTENELVGHWEGNVLEPRWRVQITNGQGILPPDLKKGWIDGPSYRVQKRGLGQ